MKLRKRTSKRKVLAITVCLLIIGVAGGSIAIPQRATAPKTNKSKNTHSQTKKVTKEPTFNATQYSTTDPSSIWVVVNKPNPLSPIQYMPSSLTAIQGQRVSSQAAASVSAMVQAAKEQGITLKILSGFRSYEYQANLYNSYVAKDGQARADTYSARPGHSEHQTGFAIDVGGVHGCDLEKCFGATPEGLWVAQHAGGFGFIVRYTEANRAVTGYDAEPWHLRYVGIDLVQEMKRRNITTLEEFFSVNGGSQY